MNQHHNPTNSTLRRFGVATALGALLGAGGLFTLSGTANAELPGPPELDSLEDLLNDDPDLDGPIATIPNGLDGPVFDGPDITVPVVPEDDGPIFDGPVTSIPIGPDGPIFDGPIITIPVVPGETPPDDTAPGQPPAEQPPAEQPEQQPTTPPADEAPTGPDSVAPFVHVTSATVDCAGMVHVTYETGATPALAPENEHVVMFSPASTPAAVTSQRLFQRPVNGVFTVDLQSPAAEAYRVFVVADFEPSNLQGVVLVDEADAAAPVDCA
jgi:hypothetical protein